MFSGISAVQLMLSKRAPLLWATLAAILVLAVLGQHGLASAQTPAKGITVSPATISVDEDGGTGTFTVVLDAAPSGDVTVSLQSANTNIATVMPSSLTFTTTNYSTPQAVTVTGVNDDDHNFGDKRSTVIYITPTGGGYGPVPAPSYPVTVVDDDDPPPLEGLTVRAVANKPNQLLVKWTMYTGAHQYLVQWKSGDQSYSETVRNDTTERVSGGYRIMSLAAGTEYDVKVTAQQRGLTVTDNRGFAEATTTTTAALVVSKSAVTVSEPSGTATYNVKLTTSLAGGRTVVVTPVSSDESAATVSGPLTFTRSNWNTDQTVTVTAVNDDVSNDRTVKITHTLSSFWSGPAGKSVDVTVTDDDAPGWNVAVSAKTYDDEILEVSWPTYSGAAKFRVQWKSGNQMFSTSERQHLLTDGAATGHEITGLTPGTRYTVRVTALDSSDAVLATSPDLSATRFGYMDGVWVYAAPGDAHMLEVDWSPAQGAVGYVIQWKVAGQTTDYNTTNRKVVLHNDNNLLGEPGSKYFTTRISGLQPDEWYQARVISYTTEGSSDAPDGDSSWYYAPTHSEITAISASPKTGSNTELDVTWTLGTTANATDVTGWEIQWKPETAATYADADKDTLTDASATSHTIDNLTAGTGYTVKVTAQATKQPYYKIGDSAETTATTTSGGPSGTSGPSGGEPQNPRRGASQVAVELSGLTVSEVDSSSASLAVSWNAVNGAEKYVVRWKTGSGDYNAGEETANTSYTITGLDADTTYSVLVEAYDTDTDPHSLITQGEASGATPEESSGATGASGAGTADEETKFYVYYDPGGDAASKDRLQEARTLLAGKGATYVSTTGTATVDELAGVNSSIMPRFFYGDPTKDGWKSQTKVNNGGLRWLKQKLAELAD